MYEQANSINLQETKPGMRFVWANINLHENSMGWIRWDRMMWVRERARELVFLYDQTLIYVRQRVGMRWRFYVWTQWVRWYIHMSKISNYMKTWWDRAEQRKEREWRKTSSYGKTLIWCGPLFSYGCDNYGGWRLYEQRRLLFHMNIYNKHKSWMRKGGMRDGMDEIDKMRWT